MTERRPQPPGSLVLGARIAELRLLRDNMTQKDLGRRASISETYVSSIEKGRRLPSRGVIRALARALGVEPGELLALADSDRVEGEPFYARSPEQARWLRRYYRFPDEILRRLDRLGQALLEEDDDGGDESDFQAGEETQHHADPDEPPSNAGAAPRR